jgi:hypothetical protein
VADARNGGAAGDYIWCAVTVGDFIGGQFAVCRAKQGGTTRMCNTSSPAMMDAIRSINGDSYIEWEQDRIESECLEITVQNGSDTAPK